MKQVWMAVAKGQVQIVGGFIYLSSVVSCSWGWVCRLGPAGTGWVEPGPARPRLRPAERESWWLEWGPGTHSRRPSCHSGSEQQTPAANIPFTEPPCDRYSPVSTDIEVTGDQEVRLRMMWDLAWWRRQTGSRVRSVSPEWEWDSDWARLRHRDTYSGSWQAHHVVTWPAPRHDLSHPPGHDPLPPASSMETAPLQMANMQAGGATSDMWHNAMWGCVSECECVRVW